MTKYNLFFEKYKQASKEAKEALLKDFLFSLPPDELMAWLKDSNKVIKENLTQLINSGSEENLQYAKTFLDDMENMLKQNTVRQAA